MSKATADLDFFGIEKPKDISSSSFASARKSQLHKLFDHQRSIRGVHEAPLCKTKPELLKSESIGSMASSSETLFPEPAPLTIFYNGTVSVFDVPRNMAENIIKSATGNTERLFNIVPATPKEVMSSEILVETFNREILSRRMSLQRFLQKRKERMVSVSPYIDQAAALTRGR